MKTAYILAICTLSLAACLLERPPCLDIGERTGVNGRCECPKGFVASASHRKCERVEEIDDAGDGAADMDGDTNGAVDAQGGQPDSSFWLASSSPPSDSSELTARGSITAIFSKRIDPDTLTAQTFRVLRADQPVAGTVRAEDDKASFTPLSPWPLGAQYSVMFDGAIRSADGDTLAPATVTLRTRDGAWTASSIDNGYEVADLTSSAAGSTAIAFLGFPPPAMLGDLSEVSVRSLDANRNWRSREVVGRDPSIPPNIDVDDSGAVAVTYRVDPSNVNLSSRKSTGSWFKHFTNARGGIGEHAVIRADGQIVLIYASYDNSAYYLHRMTTEPGAMSSSITPLAQAANVVHLRQAKVDGAARIVWEEGAAAAGVIRAANVEGYEEHVQTLSDTARGSSWLALTANRAGTSALAAWLQQDGSIANVWAARFDNGMWRPRVLVTDGSASAGPPSVAIDGAGRAFAAWAQGGVLLVSRFVPTTGWAAPRVISTPGRPVLPELKVLLDDYGNGFAIWLHSVEDRTEVWSARYLLDSGWSAPARISPEGANVGSGGRKVVADIDLIGRTMAAFIVQDSPQGSLWVARFE
jgi:hypothetical protein